MITEEQNLVISDNNQENTVKKKDDSCKEYQALKYKTMITTGTNLEKKIENETNEEQLNKFLESEILMNKSQNWNKLSKTEKSNKIKFYVNNKAKQDYKLNEEETLCKKIYFTYVKS